LLLLPQDADQEVTNGRGGGVQSSVITGPIFVPCALT